MQTVSVVDLKTHLGRYLGLVSRGETILVTSHRHPVARLVRPAAARDDVSIIAPERPVTDLDDIAPVAVPDGVDGVAELIGDRLLSP